MSNLETPGTIAEAAGMDTADREIVITRTFNAPRELVFDVWLEPRHVALWWGPRGFTTTTHEMEVKPGGMWRFIMHGPDGTDYDNRIIYQEVVRPERLVYLHDGDKEEDPERFHVTVTFEEKEEATTVTLRSVFASAEVRAAKAKFGAVELGNQTLERLGEYLAAI